MLGKVVDVREIIMNMICSSVGFQLKWCVMLFIMLVIMWLLSECESVWGVVFMVGFFNGMREMLVWIGVYVVYVVLGVQCLCKVFRCVLNYVVVVCLGWFGQVIWQGLLFMLFWLVVCLMNCLVVFILFFLSRQLYLCCRCVCVFVVLCQLLLCWKWQDELFSVLISVVILWCVVLLGVVEVLLVVVSSVMSSVVIMWRWVMFVFLVIVRGLQVFCVGCGWRYRC